MTATATGVDDPARSCAATLESPNGNGDHYALLNLALQRVVQDPADAQSALLACRSYIALGLFGPAREWLADPSSPLAAMPEFRGLAEQLARSPSGVLPWSTCRDRFERNVERLYARHPRLRALDGVFRGIPDHSELYRSADDNWHASCVEDGVRRWLPDLLDARRVTRDAKPPHDPAALFCGSYVVAHDRFLMLFDRIFDATSRMFLTFSPRIYVVEPDPVMFGLALYATDSIENVCHPRVEPFVGPRCEDELTQHLEAEPDRDVPTFLVALPSATGRPRTMPDGTDLLERLQRRFDGIRAVRECASRTVVATVDRSYAQRDRAYWRDRYAAAVHGGLRVLGLTSRFTTVLQYSMRDLKDAFERLGHKFRVLIEPNDHDLLPQAAMAEAVAEFQPDLVFAIDHLRSEHAPMIPANVPYVCWIQDQLPHLVSREAGRSVGPLEFYISPDVDLFSRIYEYPAARGLAWSMATNETIYDARPLPDAALAPYRCDVSYVSNQSQTPEAFHAEQRARTTDRGTRVLVDYFFESLPRQLAADPRHAAVRSAKLLWAEAAAATGLAPDSPDAQDRFIRFFVHPLRELIFRQQSLEWVADYCDRRGRILHLYGRGWERHPRFRKYARGVAANGDELRAVYQASRINLQIIGYSAVHQRLIDGLAAGGFFLLRYAPGDTIQRPIERLLAAMDRHGAECDRPYESGQVPELAAAWNELAPLVGEPPAGQTIRLTADVIGRCRGLAAAGFRLSAGAVFPEYDDVTYAATTEFEERADVFLADADRRRRIASGMRRVVLDRYTYSTLVCDVLRFLTAGLGAASPADARGGAAV